MYSIYYDLGGSNLMITFSVKLININIIMFHVAYEHHLKHSV